MEEAFDLVAVGNAIVDVIVLADEEISPVLGLHPNKATHVDYERLMDIIVALPDPVVSSGGGAANVVKTAARLGIRSAFIGSVGSNVKGEKDQFAASFQEDLHEAGVHTLLIHGKAPTGACVIIRMPGGLSASAACPSAALELGPHDIPEGIIRAAKVLILDGYLLGRKELVRKVLDLASYYGTTVALDVGSSAMAAEHAHLIKDIASRYPLILFLNQHEAETLSCSCGAALACPDTNATDIPEEDLYRPIIRWTEDGPFPVIVIKRGERGALVYASGDRFEAPTRKKIPLDETAAGDSFAAGFLAAWIHGKSLQACAALGNRVAREAISVSGSSLDPVALKKLAKALR